MQQSFSGKAFAIGVIIFVGVCLFLYTVRAILTPFIVSAFFAYLLYPVINYLHSYGIKRWVGAIILTLMVLAVISAAIIAFVPRLVSQSETLIAEAPVYYENISNYVGTLKNKLETLMPVLDRFNFLDTAVANAAGFVAKTIKNIPQYLMNLFSLFTVIFLIPLITFFMLFSGRSSINSLVEILPGRYVETLLSVVYEIDSVLGKYIRGQLIEVAFVGTAAFAGLSVLGFHYALLVGVIAGLANLIPYLGPSVGFALAIVLGFVQFGSWIMLLKIAVLFAAIQLVDNNLVQPVVIGSNINLGPVTVMFALLAGGAAFGFLGILFAVPAAAIIKTVSIMLIKKYKRAV
jgi:predicted PurR-regulated permease PerM